MAKASNETSKESTGQQTTVVGLFRARGQAENARNRLKTEGVSEDRIGLKVLKETAPVPPATQLELDTLSSLDPFFAILGVLRHDYVTHIRNGETALMIRGLTGDEVEDVARILGFRAAASRRYSGGRKLPSLGLAPKFCRRGYCTSHTRCQILAFPPRSRSDQA
jgi:hypothetical protein